MQKATRFSFVLIFLTVLLVLAGCGGEQSTAQNTPQSTQVTSSNSKIKVDIAPVPPEKKVPIKLEIPSIQVNAPVEPGTINSKGEMQAPQKNPWEGVSWYSAGITPGDKGSAVLAAHLDRPGGSPATFWNLKNVKVGDEIKVTNKEGKAVTFKVTKVQLYDVGKAPLKEIFNNTNGTYLNLITCAGDWIESQQQTTQRLVVYTEKA